MCAHALLDIFNFFFSFISISRQSTLSVYIAHGLTWVWIFDTRNVKEKKTQRANGKRLATRLTMAFFCFLVNSQKNRQDDSQVTHASVCACTRPIRIWIFMNPVLIIPLQVNKTCWVDGREEEKITKKCSYNNLLIILLFTCLYQLMRLNLCEWEKKKRWMLASAENSKLKTIIEIRRLLIIYY